MKAIIFILTSALNFSSIAFTQTKVEFKPAVKISGTIFTGWEVNIVNSNFIF